jgi:hypothetical protein
MQDFLGAMIGGADEVRRTFERDLELLDLPEIAREAAPGLAGCAKHHVHEGRCGHYADLSLKLVMPGLVPGIHDFPS